MSIVVPRSLDLADKLSRLNEVHKKTQFTLEKERDGSLPFLDIDITRTPDGVKYKVYRKSLNKNIISIIFRHIQKGINLVWCLVSFFGLCKLAVMRT